MNELDFLNMNLGGQVVKDMSGMSFLQWVASKVNNIGAHTPEVNEINMLIRFPPMSSKMPDEKKIELLRKLEKIGVPIP